MNNHLNAIIIGITATMLFATAYLITEANSLANIEKTQSDTMLVRDIMHETTYYDNYEILQANDKTVVIYPIFTQSAYEWGGIYDFYAGRCDECITTPIPDFYEKLYSSSGNGYIILEFLGYEIVDDIELDQNPSILEQYNKVILLHNEYVTKAEFDAITNHPKVIYLYPNALSSEVEVNYLDNTITLVRGPNYPDNGIKNGFDWKFDNSEYLLNWDCHDWKFDKINNGNMLNCYPEQFFLENGFELLKTIKDF